MAVNDHHFGFSELPKGQSVGPAMKVRRMLGNVGTLPEPRVLGTVPALKAIELTDEPLRPSSEKTQRLRAAPGVTGPLDNESPRQTL